MRSFARCRALSLAAFAWAAAPDLARAQPGLDLGGPAPVAGIAAPAGAERGSVAHLAALCDAAPENPRRGEATGLCYGFFIGVGQYHGAMHAPGSTLPPLFCLPEPPPDLRAVAEGFVAWARANPQHAGERAVDGLFRWARAAYPCPKRPDRGGRR
jgi:hypothetical protein